VKEIFVVRETFEASSSDVAANLYAGAVTIQEKVEVFIEDAQVEEFRLES
jgi:hypothetical protein